MASNSRGLVLLLLTSGFFITGLLFDYMPTIVDSQIKRSIELATNEEIQTIWSKPPVDLHSYYWLYDLVNWQRFSQDGEKPRLRKVGPYHFTSRLEKKIIELSQNKYRLTYNATRHIRLNESEVQHLDEQLTLLNPIYSSLIGATRHSLGQVDPATRPMLVASTNRLSERFNESLLINITAREALTGRHVKLMAAAKKLVETFGLDTKMPVTRDDNVFGYVALSNGTWDGPFEVYTGYQASMGSLGEIISYKGKRRLNEYQGKCNRLQASAGELRPMPVGNEQVLEMFQPAFCRIIHLKPTGLRKLQEGTAISYTIAPEDFSSAQSNPDNRCFCINTTETNQQEDYCSLEGVLQLGPCAFNAPMSVSVNNVKPDERITNSIADWDDDLLKPDLEFVPLPDNSSQFLILKRFGLIVKADITLTIFMKVIRDPQFRHTGSVPEVSYLPLVMVREMGTLPPKFQQVILNLENFLTLAQHMRVAMYLSAFVLLCWLTGHHYNKSSRDRVVPTAMAGGFGGVGGAGGSGGNSENDSERVNSADSSRSQPPSRVSRSSLDVAGSVQSGGSLEPTVAGVGTPPNKRQHQQRNRREADSERSNGTPVTMAPSGANVLSEEPSSVEAATANRRGYRIFSKVELTPAPDISSTFAQNSANATGGPKEEMSERNGVSGFNASGNAAATDSRTQELADLASDDAERPTSPTQNGAERPTGRKNWFMKVCSNFMRLLSGIRSTISDAGQLEVTENDYQDKRLEMLAGKIDDWYTNGNGATETVSDGAQMGPTRSASQTSLAGSFERQLTVGESANSVPCPSESAQELPATMTLTSAKEQPISYGNGSTDQAHLVASSSSSTEAATTPTIAAARQSCATCSLGEPDIEQVGGINVGSAASCKRRESVQSSQTVIDKNCESGDESTDLNATDAPVEGPDDKALALEHLERAFARKTDGGLSFSGQVGGELLEEEGLVEQQTEAPVCTNPATNSSGIGTGNKNNNNNVDNDGNQMNATSDQSAPTRKLDDPIDESSSLKQSAELADTNQRRSNGGDEVEEEESESIQVGYKGNSDVGGKDERRDSGVKLDSRNGISDSSFGLNTVKRTTLEQDVGTATRRVGEDSLRQTEADEITDCEEDGEEDEDEELLVKENGIGEEPVGDQTRVALEQQQQRQEESSLPSKLANRQLKIKGGEPINTRSGRTKLLNSNGNDISNGKMMAQQREQPVATELTGF